MVKVYQLRYFQTYHSQTGKATIYRKIKIKLRTVMKRVITIGLAFLILNTLSPEIWAQPEIYQSTGEYEIEDLLDIPITLRIGIEIGTKRKTYVNSNLSRRDVFWEALPKRDTLPPSFWNRINKIFPEDPKGINYLSRGDFEVAVNKAFDLLDQDDDDVISQLEFERFHFTKFDISSSCKPPQLKEKVKLISIGIGNGSGISTVTTAGQDTVTTVASAHIEEEVDPLYIFLISSTPVIWQFQGNTEAIQQLVVNSFPEKPPYHRANGITGVSKTNIHFLGPNCIDVYYEPLTREGFLAKSAIQQLVGRHPDLMIGEYDVASLSISSGKVDFFPIGKKRTEAPGGFDLAIWEVFTRFFHRGIISIDPTWVVSPIMVAPYQVLPREAGIARLVHDKKMVPIPGAIKIVKSIQRFPAALGNYNFVLASGVEIPKGRSGWSCVWREGTWELLLGSKSGRCRVFTMQKRLSY